MNSIHEQYVLFTRIPFYRSDNGTFYCDPLWAKDLKNHLLYLENFSVCCPVIDTSDVSGFTDISQYGIANCFALKADYGLKSVLLNLLPNFVTSAKAARYAEIVHSDGAGWAFPLSFYLLPLRAIMHFRWVIVIESSFWLLEKYERASLRKRVEHSVTKALMTACLKAADARVFTQSFYRTLFLKDQTERTLINPASWVDKLNVLGENDVMARAAAREEKPLDVLFPARLIPDKGIHMVFDAVRKADEKGVKLRLTFMGNGALESECRAFCEQSFKHVEAVFHPAMDYDSKFYEFIGTFDYVLIANLKQEQPRIIFDAFSQGVGIIGPNTGGVLDITNPLNATIFKTGDADCLAEALEELAAHPEAAVKAGLEGLKYAAGKTHLQMHMDRKVFLEATLKLEEKSLLRHRSTQA